MSVLLIILLLEFIMHAADCGVPALVDRNVMLNYSSTLEGAVLTLTCQNKNLRSCINNANDEQILTVTCHSNKSWIPDPADFIESCWSVTSLHPGINCTHKLALNPESQDPEFECISL